MCFPGETMLAFNTLLYRFLLIYSNLAAILEICKLDSKDAILQLANIGFWIQHTKLCKVVNTCLIIRFPRETRILLHASLLW